MSDGWGGGLMDTGGICPLYPPLERQCCTTSWPVADKSKQLEECQAHGSAQYLLKETAVGGDSAE